MLTFIGWAVTALGCRLALPRERHWRDATWPQRARATFPARMLASMAPVFAGIVQGVAGSGGPVLVYALGREGLCKTRFRATLALVWLVLNVALVATYAATGRLGASTVPYIAGLVPVLVAAIALGDWLHHRLDEQRFKRLVLVMLVGAGVALLA